MEQQPGQEAEQLPPPHTVEQEDVAQKDLVTTSGNILRYFFSFSFYAFFYQCVACLTFGLLNRHVCILVFWEHFITARRHSHKYVAKTTGKIEAGLLPGEKSLASRKRPKSAGTHSAGTKILP